MRKKLRSAKFQIFLIGFLLSAVLLTTLLISYYQNRKMKIEENHAYYEKLLIQMEGAVEDNCEDLNRMLEKIAYSEMVQEYLEEDAAFRLSEIHSMRTFLNSFSDLKYGIKDIAVIAENGDVANLQGPPAQVKEIAQEIPEKTPYYYTASKKLRLNVDISVTTCFAVGTNVYSITDFERTEKLGTVVILFNPQCLFNFMRYGSEEVLPNMILYDREENVVFSSVEDDVRESYEQQTDDYLIRSRTLEMLDGSILFLISQNDLLEGIDGLLYKLICFSIGGVLLVFLLCAFVLYNIVKPVQALGKHMSEMEEGNLRLLRKPVQLSGVTEIETLTEQFNSMMSEMNDLTHRLVETSGRLYESKIEKQQAELDFMRSQINPHFLFNTLEMIKGCAVDEEAMHTFQMLNALGKIFCYCVRGGNMVTLTEELSVVSSYMSLQKKRFDGRLEYHCEIDEELLACSIPKMVLQPLLENAVVHGIEENGAVTVWLCGKLQNGDVELIVRDDGAVLPAERIEELQRGLELHNQSSHIGMSNVHWRLKYIYGEQYGLTIQETGQGFQVMIRLPFQREQEGE